MRKLDKCFIITKFAVLSYLMTLIVIQNFKNNGIIILCILLYISINMTMHIIKRARWKKILLALSIILLIISVKFVFINFILLLPISLIEFVQLINLNDWIYLIINGLIILTINKEMMPLYVFVFILTFFFGNLTMTHIEKLNKFTSLDDKLREENYKLSLKLNKDMEYENQLRYVSQLEERNKIAQEIHDNIGHTLSASLMQLEAANLLIERDVEKSKSIIQNTIVVLREGMENVRATLRNIKPSSEQMGINRIKLLLDNFSKNNSVEVSLVYKGSLEQLSYRQWKVIQDNINESLTNTLKYSKATKVMVNINVLNKLTKVEIKDNGLGSIKISKGLGIRGIEERTEGIGGKVIIDGSNGFSVIMLLPIG